MSKWRRLRLIWAALLAVMAGLGLAFVCYARSSEYSNAFDPDIARHPDVGQFYVRSFKAGIRIPQEFRGEWSFQKKYCGTEDDDYDNRIWFKAVTVHFYDETHVVTKIEKIGPHTLHLTYNPFIKDYYYLDPPPYVSLSSDGKTLFGWDKPGEKHGGGWKKCPPSKD